MQIRERFDKKLNELRNDILNMESMVENELQVALKALDTLDTELARQVSGLDKAVNASRYAIEADCLELIATQQPTASDLRAIITVMNMTVDLERMGDQTKGVAKVIPHIKKYPTDLHLPELKAMGDTVLAMLRQTVVAYTTNNIELARSIIKQDNDVDELYASLFPQIMAHMASNNEVEKVEATYEVLRVARELERFGDLVANIADRLIYLATGNLHEGKKQKV